MRQLSQQSGYGAATLLRIIHYWLERPTVDQEDLSAHKYLEIDGTFLNGRQYGVVAIVDPQANRVVDGSYGLKEGQTAMYHFCLEHFTNEMSYSRTKKNSCVRRRRLPFSEP